MSKFDERIRGTLSADDAAFLRSLDEEAGLLRQAGDTFRGPMGRWTIVVYLGGAGFALLAGWAVMEMLAAATTRELILWFAVAAFAWIAVLGVKLWAWGRIQTLSILRELKRVELRLAAIEGR